MQFSTLVAIFAAITAHAVSAENILVSDSSSSAQLFINYKHQLSRRDPQASTTGVAGCKPSVGKQFVTGKCKTSSDCASGCCVTDLGGVCRNVLALNQGKAGLKRCAANTDGKICTK